MPLPESAADPADLRHQVREAIAYTIACAGTQRALAVRLREYFSGIGRTDSPTPQAINQWLSRCTLLASHYWPAVEEITDGIVTRRNLRPDLFPNSARLPDDDRLREARVIVERYRAKGL